MAVTITLVKMPFAYMPRDMFKQFLGAYRRPGLGVLIRYWYFRRTIHRVYTGTTYSISRRMAKYQ